MGRKERRAKRKSGVRANNFSGVTDNSKVNASTISNENKKREIERLKNGYMTKK